MLKVTARLYQAVSVITKNEFLDAISHVCPAVLQDGGQKLGLAISGGVDSMALAVMCREYLPRNGTQLRALIVDHGLRPSSEEDALETQKHLNTRLGIESDVLKLDPTPLGTKSSVETWARMYRYDAITSSYRKHGLDGLLTAHHADDQYETTLLRLAGGARSALGMRAVSELPERSGLQYLQDFQSGDNQRRISPSPCFGVTGIREVEAEKPLLRPLLAFTKARLEATCREFGVRWINDASNLDTTLTQRNALRHILSHYRLPRALEKENVMRLLHLKMDRRRIIADTVDALFAQTNIQLDLRTRSVTFRLPGPEILHSINMETEAISPQVAVDTAQKVLRKLLARIASLVHLWGAPLDEGITLSALKRILRINTGKPKGLVKDIGSNNVVFSYRTDDTWLVTSQSMTLARRSPKPFTVCPGDKIIPPTFDQHAYSWFSIYWIRINNPSSHNLVLRYPTRHDFKKLSYLLKREKLVLRDISNPKAPAQSLTTILDTLQTEKLISNLPVIVARALGRENDDPHVCQKSLKSDVLLAFPTLNLRVEGMGVDEGLVPEWIEDLTWEVWYKPVELGGQRFKDVLCIPKID